MAEEIQTSSKVISILQALTDMPFSKKGYLLIGIPVVCQLLFVGVLFGALKNSELQTLREARTKEILAEASRLLQHFYECGAALSVYATSPSELTKSHYEQSVSQVLEENRLIERLTEGSSKEGEFGARLRVLSRKGLDFIMQGQTQVERSINEMPAFRLRTLQRSVKPLFLQIAPELKVLTNQENVLSAGLETMSQIRAQRLVEASLVFGVVLNIVVAVFLAVFFQKTAESRLRFLIGNIGRFGARETLPVAIRGNDEFAKLDQSFHEMAARLDESHRKETAVIENAVDVIASLDEEGRFVTVNPACVSWMFEPTELIGKNFLDLIEQSRRFTARQIFESVKETRTRSSIETRQINKDESTIDVEWSIRWVEAEKTMFCIVHDITERKRLEQMKQEFLQVASHDLRSPMCSLSLTFNLLADGAYGELPHKALDAIQSSDKSMTRLIGMINNLLDMEKLQSGLTELSLTDFDFLELVESIVEELRPLAADRGIEFALHFLNSTPIKADPERLMQVASNLISNAIKYSPDHAIITITVANPGSNRVELRISDQGPGIPPEYRAVIFEKFKQVKGTKQKGTSGLGLAICKEIVLMHGGEIGVDSEPGKGASFWVRLPVEDSVVC